jgi:hypothetical protein
MSADSAISSEQDMHGIITTNISRNGHAIQNCVRKLKWGQRCFHVQVARRL